MTDLAGKAHPAGELYVVVTRADGTVDDYGVIARTGWSWTRPRSWPAQLRARRRVRKLNQRAGV